MRVAVFGDIHANAQAVTAVLSDLDTRGLRDRVCLGDLVGYGASPNEVVAAIAAADVPTIMGNYDDGVGFDRDDCGCAYRDDGERARGQHSLLWTRAQTMATNKEFLRGLRKELRRDIDGRRVLFVHGSPRRMNEYLFEDRPVSSFRRLAATSEADVIVFGHTHRPYMKVVDGVLFVNAGSVGKPKDGDWRACYAILDLEAASPVEFVRLSYDVVSAAAAIRATELPEEFAADIERGGAA